ncbi:MAG: hypothetical protein LBJ18_03630 [Rickettsiales bacterium]|jgi:hypothetical protein|nr:hypothetical protein [Rickettsiales bacterium]
MSAVASFALDTVWTPHERAITGVQPGDFVDGKQGRGVVALFPAAVSANTAVYVDGTFNGTATSATGTLAGVVNADVAAGSYAVVQIEGLTGAGAWIVPTVVAAAPSGGA